MASAPTAPPAPEPFLPRPRVPNYRFFGWAFLTLLVLGAGAYWLHKFQMQRNAAGLLERADQAERDGDKAEAARLLARYLGIRPHDTAVMTRHALLLADTATTFQQQRQAYLAMQAALRSDPEQTTLRRRSLDLALNLRRYPDARADIVRLLENEPTNPELHELMGRSEEGAGQYRAAATWYEKAIGLAPDRVDSYARLAALCRRRLEQPTRADELMNKMVEANPKSVRARLTRAQYLREQGNFAAAAEDLRFVRENLAADDADVLLTSADLALVRGLTDEARKSFNRGLELYPKDLRFYLGLANLELRAGAERHAEALKVLERALAALPDQPGPVWSVAELFIEAGEMARARELLGRLTRDGQAAPAVMYLQARLLLQEGKAAQAAVLLERCRNDLSFLPELALRAEIYLGLSYERLGDPDQQLGAFRRAVQLDPLSVPARRGLAAALVAVGKTDEALGLYRQLIGQTPEARFATARLLLARELAKPEGQRSWGELEVLLNQAPAGLRATVGYVLLTAEVLAGKGRRADAKKLLDEARAKEPQHIEFWLAAAGLAAESAPDDARKILDEAGTAIGDRVELRLARARLILAQPGQDVVAALKALEDGADRFPPAERDRLLLGLAADYEALGARMEDGRLLSLTAARRPDDLGVQIRLFDWTARQGDPAALGPLVETLRRLEGDTGTWWRLAEATRHLMLARRGEAAGLITARAELAELAKRRPYWPRVPLAQGELEALAGNADAAADRLQQAVALGEGRPEAVRAAVQLLLSRRRFDEARRVLQQARDRSAGAGSLDRLAAEVELLAADRKGHAVDMARRSVRAGSKDYHDYLWLGQVLAMSAPPKDGEAAWRQEVESAFRKAVEFGPQAPETWASLVSFLAAYGQRVQAEAEVEKARRALPEAVRGQALAPCYEALGRRDDAEREHLALLAAKPGDPGQLRALAGFYLRSGQKDKATKVLQQMTALTGAGTAETAAWARRALALSMSGEGNYQRSSAALTLIEENLRERPGSPEDLRAQALILAFRPGGRRQAIRALEDSFARLRPTPAEEFLLAQLYAADRNWPKAKERLLALLTGPAADSPEVVAYFVQALLRQGGAAEAAPWVARLEAAQPKAFRTAELKARLLHRQGQAAAAAKVLVDCARQAEQENRSPEHLRAAAEVLASLGQPAAAEPLFRRYVALTEEKAPQTVAYLAQFLARQDRVSEALNECEKLWARCDPELAARVSVSVLRLGHAAAPDFTRIEARITSAMTQKPAALDLPVSLADFRDAQGHTAEAIQLYRAILKGNPRHALALNNLAWLVALFEHNGAEALHLVNQAIALAGPEEELLDTRGVANLVAGQARSAVDDFEEVLARSADPTAYHYYHLAQAYQQAGNQLEAQKAWKRATELGVKPSAVHPLERPAYEQLAQALGVR